MKTMDREIIEKSDISQRYLLDRLTPEEAEEFEVYLMDNPEIVDELELDAMLKKYQEVSRETHQNTNRFLSWLDHQLVSFAGLTSSLILGFLLYWQSNTTSDLPAEAMTDFSVISLGTQRSIQQPLKEVNLNSSTGSLIFDIEPSNYEEDLFTLFVKKKDSGVTVFILEDVPINNRGNVMLLIPKSSLTSGIYEIEMLGHVTGNKEVHSFSINTKS